MPWRVEPGQLGRDGATEIYARAQNLQIGRWQIGEDGTDRFDAFGDAVVNTVNVTDYPFFVSANNFSTDACLFSPAAGSATDPTVPPRARTRGNPTGRVFVVGGTAVDGEDPNDYRYQFWVQPGPPWQEQLGQDSGSNSGRCISLWAPRSSIYVARTTIEADRVNGVSNASVRVSGTSFASPLVAGIAARYIEREINRTGVQPTAEQVYAWLLRPSSQGGASGKRILWEETPELVLRALRSR